MCYLEPVRKILLLLILSGMHVAATGYAQVQRLLPQNAKRGELVGQQYVFPLVQINNKVMKLAPGGLIFDQNNRTILHGYLPPYADVLYTIDTNGQVARIYILTPREQATLDRAGTR